MKSHRIYTIIIICWLLLIATFCYDLEKPLITSYHKDLETFVTVLVATLFICYFWLNGLKDIIYTLYFYRFFNKRVLNRKIEGIQPHKNPSIDLVYCTHNDFTPESLLASMKQDYSNYQVIILDDSTDPLKIEEIKKFSKQYGVRIIRRDTRKGHKAGNLNNYLKDSTAEFFVILDSDETIPPDFITHALPYFQDPKIAVVQGNHVAVENKNQFMKMFADGVESHWYTYQNIKHSFGFLSFLGHGAMIRASAYHEIKGFPELVAEDLCFSIELRNKGYYVAFAPEIICWEQFPISYLAFKKRHAKWTQGNMEFIKSYSLNLLTSPMHWYEKLDIVLFTYSLPLSVFFALYLIINIIIFPVLHFSPNYPLPMLIPTGVFLLAPMINDIVYFSTRKKHSDLAFYIVSLVVLYGSLFYLSFRSSFKALFSQAQFIVTPKSNTYISFRQAVWLNRGELVFSAFLLSASYLFLRSFLPVILIAIPSILSVYLTALANYTI